MTLWWYIVFPINRKVLNKGVLLYIHFNLFLALLLALIVFVGGIETSTHTKVSIYDHLYILKFISLSLCMCSGCVVQWQQYCTTSFSVCSAGVWLRASWSMCWLSEYSAIHLRSGITSFLLDGVCINLRISCSIAVWEYIMNVLTGVPIPIVAVSLGVRHEYYGTDTL